MTKRRTSTDLTRRSALKQLAAGAATIGAGSVLGAPMIWAQTIKDVTLMHVGPSYSIFPDIAAQRPRLTWASRSRCRKPGPPTSWPG